MNAKWILLPAMALASLLASVSITQDADAQIFVRWRARRAAANDYGNGSYGSGYGTFSRRANSVVRSYSIARHVPYSSHAPYPAVAPYVPYSAYTYQPSYGSHGSSFSLSPPRDTEAEEKVQMNSIEGKVYCPRCAAAGDLMDLIDRLKRLNSSSESASSFHVNSDQVCSNSFCKCDPCLCEDCDCGQGRQDDQTGDPEIRLASFDQLDQFDQLDRFILLE